MRDVAASVAALRDIWATNPTMHKTADDLARYELLLDRVRPDTIVETGLLHGGSHRWFAERVPLVVTVEANPAEIAAFSDRPANGHVIEGDSREVADQVAALVHGTVMVVLDSDHGTDVVYGEMSAYGPLVTPGSYMVVEDGIYGYLPSGPLMVGNWYDGNPLVAIGRYLCEHPGEWHADVDVEDLHPTTQHPSGWLRRLP